MKIHFLRVGMILMCLLAAGRVAEACSCGGSGNVLESFEHAKNVVLVTATNVTLATGDEHAVDGVTATRMTIDKVYKGTLKIGDEITFAQGGGADCIWTFSERSIGKKFLFYLGEGSKTTRWIAIVCGRSNFEENAGEDLRYLNNLARVRGKTRLSGTIEFDGVGDFEAPSAEAISIKVIGPGGTRSLKTDKNGVYELYGLAPGTYQIVPEIPRGWRINQFYLGYENDLTGKREEDNEKLVKTYSIRLQTSGHASLSFHFEIDNALRGQVLDPNGNPMKGVCVRLYPPSGVTKDFFYNADCTEADGRFVLDEIPPGNYIIVANDENEISSSEPFRTLYYPGVFDLTNATVLSVGIGEFREGLDIRVPAIEELATIEGRFLWSDGSPVVDELVKFLATDTTQVGIDRNTQSRTDERGRFALKVLKGAKGKLIGSMYAYIGKFEKCPKLEAFIRSKGKTGADVASDEIVLEANENITGMDIKLPFPSCKISKD